MWEVGLIVVVALIVLGPRQLADTARVLGRLYRELQKMTSDFRESVDWDSLTAPPRHHEPHPTKNDVPPPAPALPDLVAPPGEKSGPDFYAELLEKSLEEAKVEPEKAGESSDEKQDTGQTEQDGLPGEKDRKKAVPEN